MCAILQLHQREHQEKVELLRELPYLAKAPRADLLKMVLQAVGIVGMAPR